MITIIAAVLGIISTVLAWNLNPKRRLYADLDAVYLSITEWEKKRDDALAASDSDLVTIAVDMLSKLRARKALLLQRL